MTHSSGISVIATAVVLVLLASVVLQLLMLAWPRSVAAKISQIA